MLMPTHTQHAWSPGQAFSRVTINGSVFEKVVRLRLPIAEISWIFKARFAFLEIVSHDLCIMTLEGHPRQPG